MIANSFQLAKPEETPGTVSACLSRLRSDDIITPSKRTCSCSLQCCLSCLSDLLHGPARCLYFLLFGQLACAIDNSKSSLGYSMVSWHTNVFQEPLLQQNQEHFSNDPTWLQGSDPPRRCLVSFEEIFAAYSRFTSIFERDDRFGMKCLL